VARPVALSPDGDYVDLGRSSSSSSSSDPDKHDSPVDNSQAAANHQSANCSANDCTAHADHHAPAAQHFDNVHYYDEFDDLDVDHLVVIDDDNAQSIGRLSANLPSSEPS
jgi:hypothetical protein